MLPLVTAGAVFSSWPDVNFAANGGRTAISVLCWVNTRGDKGAWSEVTTAKVAA